MTTEKRVFISYAHADAEFVRRLRAELESRGVDVWVDEKEVLVGDSITQKIEQGLATSDFFCLVLSPTSVTRPWVQREYRSALSIQLSQQDGGIRILPIKTTDVSLPPLLKDIRFADFSKGFMAGLYELCSAIGLPRDMAPFVDIAQIFEVTPEDLPSAFQSAFRMQDMNMLTPVWHSVVNGAHRLNDELTKDSATTVFRIVPIDGIHEFLRHPEAGVGLVPLPPIDMRESIGSRANDAYGFSYKLIMDGVDSLLSCIGRWFKEVKSRRFYLVPDYVTWETGWSENGETGSIQFKDFIRQR